MADDLESFGRDEQEPACAGVCRDREVVARYEQNVSAIARRIAGVARPRSVAEVVALVRAANAHGDTLHPISTGANWGLGSRLPVRDNAVIVDLGALDRIVSIDERLGVAVIEPGVTQGQLARALAHTRFRLDVTGSAPATSVIGNALDRGIAHDGPRADKLRILEVVLGTGELVRFDHAGTTGGVAALYRWGLGPAVHDLFFQSSYGIVTRAAIRLEPRTADVAVLRCPLVAERDLAGWIDAARDLVDRNVLPASLHVSNRARTRSVLGGLLARDLGSAAATRIVDERIRAPWSLACTLRGEPAQLRVAHAIARRVLAPFGPVTLTRARRARVEAKLGALPGCRERGALARAAIEVFGHSLGEPSDGGLASIAFSLGLSAAPLDAGNAGTLFALPLVPMSGRDMTRLLAIVHAVVESPYITLNGTSRMFEVVLNVTFDRREPARVQAAHTAVAELLTRVTAAGYPPYRTAITHMPEPTPLQRAIKQLLDPRGVLAPGR